MRQKFYKKNNEEKEEEKNMDLDKSLDKMNIDEELALNELKEPQKINNKNKINSHYKD